MKTVGVILAGGTGTRMGLETPKQLLRVSGKRIIEHTLDTFQADRLIDEIIVVMTAGLTDEIVALAQRNGYTKIAAVLPGGRERSESSRVAIDALGGEECKILFHDAVRPFVSHRIIADCVAALDTYKAVDVAIPSADTIIEVQDDQIVSIPPRARLMRGQTPQAFMLSTIRRAYDLAALDPGFTSTDDCGVVLRYLPDVAIGVVPGSENNIKITHALDVFLADKLFQLRAESMEGPGSDADYADRLRDTTMVVFGGSYGIGHEIAELARGYGASVHTFSRSGTNTHIENPADVERALEQAYVATGRIDFVVNTAAILEVGDLVDMSEDDIQRQIAINFTAPVTIARAAAPYLAKTHGHLLLFTSSSYTRGRAHYSLYSSSKAGVVNLTQALADEWSEQGIKVNCINPERAKTPMRIKNFGNEPEGTLLTADAVARRSLDVLVSTLTGQVIDVRRKDSYPEALYELGG